MKCTHTTHVGPFRPRPDIRRWMIEILREVKDHAAADEAASRDHFDCLACSSTVSAPRQRHLEVAA